MSAHNGKFALDEALERAYRLALGVHGLANDKLREPDDPAGKDLSLWVMASELLCVLDAARTLRVRREAADRTTD